MRRSAAVVLAAGTLVASVGVIAAPAQAAAPLKGRYVSKNGWKTIEASGSFTRTGRQVRVALTLKDTARDGRTACVRFRFEPAKGQGRNADVQTYFLKDWLPKKQRWVRADRPMTQKGQTYSYMTGHAFVRECSMDPRAKRKLQLGPARKLY